MATLRHAAYRASLLSSSAFRSSRIAIRPSAYTPIARSSINLFSTRHRFLSEGIEHQSQNEAFPPPRQGFSSEPQLEQDSEAIANPDDTKSLYVGNLFFDVTPGQVRQHFETFGQISGVKVVTSPEGYSKGFAFVSFTDAESARKAQEQTNLSVFAGRRIVVHYARPNNKPQQRHRTREPTSTLFIGNLSYDTTDKELNEIFRSLKNVREVRVSVDRNTGKPRGFAHADFINVNSATAALEQLQGLEVKGRRLRCDYGMAKARKVIDEKPDLAESSAAPQYNAPAQSASEKTLSVENEQKDEDVSGIQAKEEGSHEPPQDLEEQPEKHPEKDFEQPGEHATQQLEEEAEQVPEDQADQHKK